MKKEILFFDIETNGVNARNSDLGIVVVFGYAWNDEPAKSIIISEKHLKKFDDSALLREASELMSQADILVAHYGSMFDRRFLNGRLLIHGLPPATDAVLRDTVFAYRRVAAFSSNRLQHLARILHSRHKKLDKGWPEWWFEVMRGNMTALRDMAKYCRGDVEALRELYYKVAPYVKAWRT